MVLFVGDDWSVSWPRASAAITQADLLLMVAALGLTAQRVSGIHRGRNEEILASRDRSRLEFTSLAADVTWLVAVYLTMTGIVWALMWSRGVPGGPWLEYPVFGVCGVVFAAALGHTFGRLVPGRFTGVLAAVTGYLLFLVLFPSGESPLTASVGYQAIDVRLSGAHLGWRLALTTLTVLVAVGAVHLVSRDRRRPLTALIPAAAVLVGIAAMPSGSESPLVQPREASGRACADTGHGGEVCVWPEHAHRLSEATAAAERVGEAAAPVLPTTIAHREHGLDRGGVGGFTLDHGPGDTLATLAGEYVDRAIPYCADWQEEQWGAHSSLRLWLDARARGLGTLPDYNYQSLGASSDFREEVEETLARPEEEQRRHVRTWVETARAVTC
ncbi:DUF7224 domain-containing protein [Streptomyces otsuchiensis]|uniref:DUF7224 domain-containing protein n=1 Tax=Streptomyces otsuchiensis TaxID=2681388 RepID=UPI001032569F|nr:hypothetical protein [Streptomyces otsuchiensis]